jgi:hypothetical protein
VEKGRNSGGEEIEIIIMNGKLDTNLVQADSQEFLRSHRIIGVGFNVKLQFHDSF